MNDYLVRALLYEAIVELEYIQCVESPGDHSLCQTSHGREIVKRGMELLNLEDLSGETFRQAKFNP
jgi:hypothetical protein